MDVTVNTSDLHKVLSKLAPLAKGGVLPSLSYVKLQTKEGSLQFSVSNLEVWADKQIPAEVTTEGTLYINTGVFNEFISTLKVENVRLQAENENLIIEAENVHALINGMVDDSFPVKPVHEALPNSLSIELSVLFSSIDQVADAASDEQATPVLTGVYLHTREDKLYMVATDRYRLACQFLMDSDKDIKLLLPAKTMQYIPKLFDGEDNVSISYDDMVVVFESTNTSLLCRMVEGEYPEYEKLLPKTFKTKIQVGKGILADALQSATVFSKNVADSATLIFSEEDQRLSIEGESQDGDSVGSAKMSIEVQVEGDPISIKLNGKYALNALNHMKTDMVSIGLNERLSPIIFTDDLTTDSYTQVVMPLDK